MATQADALEELRNLEAGELLPVVRNVLSTTAAEIDGKWNCDSFDAVSIGVGTLAFFRLAGRALVGGDSVPWSVIVKVMEPSQSPFAAFNHPEREFRTYQSGFPPSDRPGMRAVQCYKSERRPDGSIWLWLQNLAHLKKDRWTEDDYVFAARQVGLFNGAGPESTAEGLDWIQRRDMTDRRAVPVAEGRQELFQSALKDPLVQRSASGIGLQRVEQLYEDVRELIDASSGFPKLVSHNDCHARNLFIDPEASELIAIDWASVAVAPAGVDGGTLVASGFTWGREESRMVTSVEKAAFSAYYEGLTRAGWRQPRDEVRMVFLTLAATYTLQCMTVLFRSTTNLRYQQMLTARIAPTLEGVADEFAERQVWALPMIDEALSLIGR